MEEIEGIESEEKIGGIPARGVVRIVSECSRCDVINLSNKRPQSP